MMKDREFLIWIHDRLENVHGVSRDVDHMRRLRNIILATPTYQHSPNLGRGTNDLAKLVAEFDARGGLSALPGCERNPR